MGTNSRIQKDTCPLRHMLSVLFMQTRTTAQTQLFVCLCNNVTTHLRWYAYTHLQHCAEACLFEVITEWADTQTTKQTERQVGRNTHIYHKKNSKMKGKTKYVAFSTQKGGAGKTTITVLVASYLHYVKGYNVAVIDCDYPQHSILEMRDRDLKLAMEDQYYKGLAYEQFTRLNKKAYPVVGSNTKMALVDTEPLLSHVDLDFIFFVLPGTINDHDLIYTLARMDYIIAPISADRVVVESTLNFIVAIKEHLIDKGKSDIKGLYMLWNMVDGREKSELYEVYEQVMKELGLPILRTFLPDTKRFRREQSLSRRAVFRSTLFPADKSLLRGSHLEELVDELIELFK